MGRRYSRKKSIVPPEMDVTTFLNLMVVLVPFLLITAVFSRITVVELDIPAGSGGAIDKPQVIIEVIIRKDKLELGNGKGIVARLANTNGTYDLDKLSKYLFKVKKNYPDKTDALLLVELDVEYNDVIQVMDAVRSAEFPLEDSGGIEKVVLFPDMSLGDAP